MQLESGRLSSKVIPVSKSIKISAAHFQCQQATPTPTDSEIAEIERRLFSPMEPFAALNVPPTVRRDRPSPTRIVKNISISKLPGRTPSTPKKQRKKTNKPATRKRISRK